MADRTEGTSGHDFGGTLQILGVILPIYAIIDMIETAENVWSDCCICAVVNKELGNEKKLSS